MKRTPLHDQHLAAGAKMVEFAGFEMPISYAGLKEEHNAVRNSVGMFDVSHMGEIFVEGPEALAFVQWISSNDASKLNIGDVQYSCMPNGKGGIVDDLLVYRLAASRFMLVVNASNLEKDWAWMQQQNSFDVQLSDHSDAYALIALQGPRAAEVLAPLADTPSPAELKYYSFREGHVAGKPAIISATGYTGAGGFELYLAAEDAPGVWDALLEAGVPPCGLGARDTLRLEAGFCLYGSDIDEHTSPIAAGLSWITKFSKDFVDRETLEAEKAQGPAERLRGLRMEDRGVPRAGYEVVNDAGEAIGRLTSGTQSPTLGIGIGLAYIARSQAQIGDSVFVRIRNKDVPATITKPGFLPS
jgi:aminomethyltransferase